MKRLPVEKYARQLSQAKTDSVRAATVKTTQARVVALPNAFIDPEGARNCAADIKDYVLDHIWELQKQLMAQCSAHGIQVHLAPDAKSANEIISKICHQAAREGGIIVKAKSMATEEIHLNQHLEKDGFEVVETDLGEYVVQIEKDTPSHIVTPIIHKNKREVAAAFRREELGPYTEVPEELAMQARVKLREKFRQAKIGISGVNFAIAETGRLVLVENEGNNRLSTTAPNVHIALMGIEKMLPREGDLPLFLKLLAGSATGQHLTTYTHLISGPRQPDEVDGPAEVHLVLLDNGRSEILKGPYREILRCIRCGACLNVCPVYRQASGHAYGHVYSGPLGAVLAPALEGVEAMGHLAKASTLCGACEEVCPVKIPIPRMLLQLRDEGTRMGAIKDPVQWGAYAAGATNPGPWRLGISLLPMASKLAPHPMKSGWGEFHQLPTREGRNFRDWWRGEGTRDEGQGEGLEVRGQRDQGLGTRDEGSGERLEDRGQRDQGLGTRDEGSGERLEDGGQRADLWGQFAEKLGILGGRMATLEDLDLEGKVCFLDPDVQEFADCPQTKDVWSADIGVTRAELAIAETGSVLVAAGRQRSRLASLAPPTHIILVKEIVATVEEAFAKMSSRTSVVITGTSRTADIEGVLVRGVHGPKEVIVVRMP